MKSNKIDIAEQPITMKKSIKNKFFKPFFKNRVTLKSIGLFSLLLVSIGIILVIILSSTLSKDKLVLPSENYECYFSHETYESFNISNAGNYSKFAVAVDNKFCSEVGKEILLKNGSAVDAAIASGLCNGISNAQSCGIGGGHFMIIYLKEKNIAYAIDAREQAPINSDQFMFQNKSSLIGGSASGIPGEIYGFWEAYKIGGRLPWKELFSPVIKMCEEGFHISYVLANSIKNNEKLIRNNRELSQIFINNKTNEIYKENEIIKMPKLGKTLRIISEENITAFYNGSLTQLMVDEINENGGIVTLEDFKNYKAIVKTPITVKLDENYKLFTQPLPSSGILVSLIMKIMKGFKLNSGILADKNESKLFYHRLVEAFKHSFSQRSLLGDERYENMTELIEKLQNETFIDQIRLKIDDQKTFPSSYYASSSGRNSHGTAHLSVLGSDAAVSLTSTINIYFGAGYAGSKTGIIFNNQMDDFSSPNLENYFHLKPSESNFIKPGKRPMSSMSPIIVIDKENSVKLILGASGGSKILTSVAQVAIKNLWMNQTIKKSIDDRRLHHQLYPEYISVESGFDREIRGGLEAIGHKTSCFSYGGSVLQGISVAKGKYIEAYSDPRKGGVPAGF